MREWDQLSEREKFAFLGTLAVQAQTFSEYIIKGLDLTISNEWCLFALEKLIGFSLICNYSCILNKTIESLQT